MDKERRVSQPGRRNLLLCREISVKLRVSDPGRIEVFSPTSGLADLRDRWNDRPLVEPEPEEGGVS